MNYKDLNILSEDTWWHSENKIINVAQNKLTSLLNGKFVNLGKVCHLESANSAEPEMRAAGTRTELILKHSNIKK